MFLKTRQNSQNGTKWRQITITLSIGKELDVTVKRKGVRWCYFLNNLTGNIKKRKLKETRKIGGGETAEGSTREGRQCCAPLTQGTAKRGRFSWAGVG